VGLPEPRRSGNRRHPDALQGLDDLRLTRGASPRPSHARHRALADGRRRAGRRPQCGAHVRIAAWSPRVPSSTPHRSHVAPPHGRPPPVPVPVPVPTPVRGPGPRHVVPPAPPDPDRRGRPARQLPRRGRPVGSPAAPARRR
jgi:hypothetical protein